MRHILGHTLLAVILQSALFLTGCGTIRLYHSTEDDVAKKAQAAFVAADLKNALTAERAALQTFAAREQDTVQRNQLSLRDWNLVAFLSATSATYGWNALQHEINFRYTALTGKGYAQGVEIETQLRLADEARAKLGPLISTYLLASQGNRLECTDPLSASQAADQAPELALVYAPFKQACIDYVTANNNLINLEANGGALQKIMKDVAAVQKAQVALEDLLATANKNYQEALKNVTSPDAQPGHLAELGAKLKAKYDDLDIAKTINADTVKSLTDDPILAHLLDVGRLQQLIASKDAIDTALQALQGNAPSDALPAMRRLSALSNWDTAISAKPAPAVGNLILQADFLHLEAKSVEQRIARGKERISLYQEKRKAMLDELIFLNEAQKQIHSYDGSHCDKHPDLYQSFRAASPNCRAYLARGLAAYLNAATFGRSQQELIDYQLIEQGHDAALDDSEIALAQTDGLIRPSLDLIATTYASGIKAEDLSNLINALGLSAIAVRVK
jgi:hypothetical protein